MRSRESTAPIESIDGDRYRYRDREVNSSSERSKDQVGGHRIGTVLSCSAPHSVHVGARSWPRRRPSDDCDLQPQRDPRSSPRTTRELLRPRRDKVGEWSFTGFTRENSVRSVGRSARSILSATGIYLPASTTTGSTRSTTERRALFSQLAANDATAAARAINYYCRRRERASERASK